MRPQGLRLCLRSAGLALTHTHGVTLSEMHDLLLFSFPICEMTPAPCITVGTKMMNAVYTRCIRISTHYTKH